MNGHVVHPTQNMHFSASLLSSNPQVVLFILFTEQQGPLCKLLSELLLNLKILSPSPLSPFSFQPPRSKYLNSCPLFLATASRLRMSGAGVGGKGDTVVLDTCPLSTFPNPGPLKPSQISLEVSGSCSIPRVFLSCFDLLKGEKRIRVCPFQMA